MMGAKRKGCEIDEGGLIARWTPEYPAYRQSVQGVYVNEWVIPVIEGGSSVSESTMD